MSTDDHCRERSSESDFGSHYGMPELTTCGILLTFLFRHVVIKERRSYLRRFHSQGSGRIPGRQRRKRLVYCIVRVRHRSCDHSPRNRAVHYPWSGRRTHTLPTSQSIAAEHISMCYGEASYWSHRLQSTEPDRHAAVPIRLSATTDGQDQDNRAGRIRSTAGRAEFHDGNNELFRVRYRGCTHSQQSQCSPRVRYR